MHLARVTQTYSLMPTTYLLMVTVLSLLMNYDEWIFFIVKGKIGIISSPLDERKSSRGRTSISNGTSFLSFFFLNFRMSLFLLCIFIGSQPFFGMFGYGGPVAAMCLGRYKLCELFSFTHKKMKHLDHSVFLVVY